MSDDRTIEILRSALDSIVDDAPELPEFDVILSHAAEPSIIRRSPVQLGVVAVGVSLVLVTAVVGSSIWLARGGGGDGSSVSQETTTTTAPETTTTVASEVTTADGRIYAEGDCPAAATLLVGGYDAADALPPRDQTERARVEGLLGDVRQRYVASTSGVIDVRVIPRNGEVWYRLDDGGYAVELVEDYQFEFLLAADAPCPTGPTFVNGVPVLYTRADDEAIVGTASTESLRLDVVDTYPLNAGIDSLFLRNTGAEPVDVSGWTISSRGFREGFAVPNNTVIRPGESIAIYQFAETRGAPCPEDTARAFFHCNALGQDTVTGDMLFPIPIITVLDSNGTLVLESQP